MALRPNKQRHMSTLTPVGQCEVQPATRVPLKVQIMFCDPEETDY